MKQLVCEMCGGKELIKQDGVFVCQNCQAKYSVEEAKKMMVEADDPVKLENKNYEPSPKPLNLLEEKSTPSLDLDSFATPKKKEKSFFTTPLAPDGCGCGCFPAIFTSPIFIIAWIVLIVIGTIITPEESQTQKISNQKQGQEIEARVTLKQSIEANLRDPKSYQNIAIDVYTVEEYLFVKNTFRGKNLYGGYEVCTFVARFNFNTKPPGWTITNNPKSDSGCRNIMIALP